MISRFKAKIILWYTVLMVIILGAVSISLFSLLSHQLLQEVDEDLIERAGRIDRFLRDRKTDHHRGRDKLDNIVSGRRVSFWDVRELTDEADDKYLLMVYFDDDLVYISKKYRKWKSSLPKIHLRDRTTATHTFEAIPFRLTALNKQGFSLFLGFELSTIRGVQARIRQIFLLVFPFGVFLSVLCGYIVTQRSLNIINNISQTASRITSKNLSERIPEPRGEDEITHLIITLNTMIDRLEKSFTLIQQFSHDAAHEIRTPLTIVRGQIEELLTDEECSEYTSKTLESILEEMEYLSAIANKLLLLNSFDTGKIEYHFTTVNMSRLIQEIYEDAQVLASQKNLTITLNSQDGIEIQGNDELLMRLLWNIVDNAIKYNSRDGDVSIMLEKKNNQVSIEVADTGVGISHDDISKIFDRFYRVDKSRSRVIGGSGLGLAIAKWIIELHRGTIDVESTPGQGSRFIMTFPTSTISEKDTA